MNKITVDVSLLTKALEALENSSPDQYPEGASVFYDARDALRAALTQPAQEPVVLREGVHEINGERWLFTNLGTEADFKNDKFA